MGITHGIRLTVYILELRFSSVPTYNTKTFFSITPPFEGVPAVLEAYANKYGVALINSQARFVDYVKDFVKAAMKDSLVVTCC